MDRRWPHAVSLKILLSGYIGQPWSSAEALGSQYLFPTAVKLRLCNLLYFSGIQKRSGSASIQAGHKLQVRRKGLPQEIASNLKPAQSQFIYFPPPNSIAHNNLSIFVLCFCLNAGLWLVTDEWHWGFFRWWLVGWITRMVRVFYFCHISFYVPIP